MFLKIWQYSQESTYFIQKRLHHRCSVNIVKFLGRAFLQNSSSDCFWHGHIEDIISCHRFSMGIGCELQLMQYLWPSILEVLTDKLQEVLKICNRKNVKKNYVKLLYFSQEIVMLMSIIKYKNKLKQIKYVPVNHFLSNKSLLRQGKLSPEKKWCKISQ